jgi:hypothetical protein
MKLLYATVVALTSDFIFEKLTVTRARAGATASPLAVFASFIDVRKQIVAIIIPRPISTRRIWERNSLLAVFV